jgi:serine protease
LQFKNILSSFGIIFGLILSLLVAGPVGATSESVSLPENLPNDPYVPFQTKMVSPTLQLPYVWDMTHMASDIVVAVIDTGVDYNHEDLSQNIWINPGEIDGNGLDDDDNGYVDDVYGYDFYDENSDPMDAKEHGTHIAGIIGAVGNNNIGMAGIAWNIQIMALKITGNNGKGNVNAALSAIQYAIDNGADIINSSWIVNPKNDEVDKDYIASLRRVIRRAEDAGILFVTGSGNGGHNDVGFNIDTTPIYPASLKNNNIVTVAALDFENNLAPYSNFGTNSVDLATQGSAVLGTLPRNRYGYYSGTSMATAVVSGAAALLMQQHPGWSATEVKSVLLDSVTSFKHLSGKVKTSGALDIFKSLTGQPVEDLAEVEEDEVSTSAIDEGANAESASDNVVAQNSSSFGCTLQAGPSGQELTHYMAYLLFVLALGCLALQRQRQQ